MEPAFLQCSCSKRIIGSASCACQGGGDPLQRIALEVVKLPKAKRAFVLLPRRWVVERSFAGATRFRRLVKDYEGYAGALAGLHLVAFTCLMLKKAALLAAGL